MNAYKKYVVIDNSQQLVLSDLPFAAGQKVEVIILAEEDNEVDGQLEELHQKSVIFSQNFFNCCSKFIFW
ncbi:MAG: hypothetical protein F6K39_08145 [Okeania sp. SIO3B3]|nr:hypothetical protein [Okeania sp. SIO3B3]